MTFSIVRTTAADEMGGIRALLSEAGAQEPAQATLTIPGFTPNKVLLDQIRTGGVLELIIGKSQGGIVTPPGPKPDPVPSPIA